MFEFLSALLEKSPLQYTLTLILFALVIGAVLFILYKFISKFTTAHIGKDGVNLGVDSPSSEPPKSVDNSIVLLVLELQAELYDYIEEKQKIKAEAIEDQLKKFRSEQRTFIVYVKDKYISALYKAKTPEPSYSILFDYWFKSVFEEPEEDIKIILDRNHLKFKSADEFTDIINQLYDTTFSEIVQAIENAPGYIKNNQLLYKTFVDSKAKYREYLDVSLQNAKRISEQTAKKVEEFDAKLTQKKEATVKRTFPNLSADAIESISKGDN